MEPSRSAVPPTVRAATPDDYGAFVRLFPELETGDPLVPPETWLAEMMPCTLLLELSGEVVAYGYTVILGDKAYVRHVVVAKEARGRGLGRALMRAIAREARASGSTRWCLNVKIDNTPAVRLYEAVGMKVAYASTPMSIRWDAAAGLPSEEGIEAAIVAPDEDAAIERAFGLPSGRIAEARARAGWVVLRLFDPADRATSLGIACFNPAFPGAFPFRVARPTLARPLLEAMKPHALPAFEHVGIVMEDDPETKRALVDAGATIRFELVNMEGPIPDEV